MTLFPEGPDGICHPFNIEGFSLQEECVPLYTSMFQPYPGWQWDVVSFATLARQSWNCSSVKECAYGQLFLTLGAWTTPGFWGIRRPPVLDDRWRLSLWKQAAANARAARQRELQRTLRAKVGELLAATVAESRPVKASSITLGIHADAASASGKWKGQLEFWKAYASVHGLRWFVDTEQYFTGQVFARYWDHYWASTDESWDGFWQTCEYLAPHSPPSRFYPRAGTFCTASLDNSAIFEGLVIFTQPPQYWDSLEALWAVVSQNEWTIWIDYDLSLSPCCFDSFSFVDLIEQSRHRGALPHVIFRDSPKEDYSHHCANAGFVVVRNTAVGRLFLELAREKRSWPAIPYGYQGAMAESFLELLGIEWALFGHSSRHAETIPEDLSELRKARYSLGYRSQCLPNLILGSASSGLISYANFCQCYRTELRRLAGPESARRSRWLRLLETHQGPEMGLLLASLFIHRGGTHRSIRGVGVLPEKSWSRERHRSYIDAWLPSELSVGGPCGVLPLVTHWASLPHRPRLIYEFLNARFPDELKLSVLENGTAEELAIAYREAAVRGRKAWNAFLKLPAVLRDPDTNRWNDDVYFWADLNASQRQKLSHSNCNLGSARMWDVGGFPRHGRSTDPYS